MSISTESWLAIGSGVGSAASIIGAMIAIAQSRKATNAATKAEQMHSELMGHRAIAESARIYSECQRIRRQVSKIGPTSKLDLLEGFDTSELSQDVLSLSALISDHTSTFPEEHKDAATKFSKDLHRFATSLSETPNTQDLKKIGIKIYTAVNQFTAIAKDLADHSAGSPSVPEAYK